VKLKLCALFFRSTESRCNS